MSIALLEMNTKTGDFPIRDLKSDSWPEHHMSIWCQHKLLIIIYSINMQGDKSLKDPQSVLLEGKGPFINNNC